MHFGAEQQVDLAAKLATHKPLTIKLGFDPTSPDLHLGHYVVLRGAKSFQDLGHNVTIIVGDFTASIGDPSGRNKLRPPLSEDDIAVNAQTYMDQVFLVLDQDKTIVKRNSGWLKSMDMGQTLALLSQVTLSQILVRDDFRKRFDAQTPVHLHELVYPLLQGLDSVEIQADVELGGSDQLFNLMMGRQLQKTRGQKEQAVVTFPLLVGLDGEKKMSKSLGNHIGLRDDPKDKFGKIMSISDDTMWNYWAVLVGKNRGEICMMQHSGVNFKILKMDLAEHIVALFHGADVAQQERAAFDARFARKEHIDVEEVDVVVDGESVALSKLIKDLNMASSSSDAGRKIEQHGVKINDQKVTDKTLKKNKGEEFMLQVGKLHIKKVRLT